MCVIKLLPVTPGVVALLVKTGLPADSMIGWTYCHVARLEDDGGRVIFLSF